MCMMDRFNSIEEALLSVLEGQLANLEEVCAKEMGEVVDMIKDLEEAKYYCAVTDAMESSETEGEVMWNKPLMKMSTREIKSLLGEAMEMLEREPAEEKTMSVKKL